MWVRIAVCCAWLASASLVHGAARAEDAAPAQSARSLFEEGLKHVDAQAWSEAEASFRQAMALRDSVVIRFNLAVTLIELSRFVEALRLLREVDADLAAGPDLRARLPEIMAAATRRAAKLTLRVDGASAGAEVMLDERTLAPDELGVTQLVDPGVHSVRLRRHGEDFDVRRLELVEGVEQLVVLALPAVATPAVATPAEAAAQAEAKSGPVDAKPAPRGPAPLALAPQPHTSDRADGSSDVRAKRRRWGISAGALAVGAGVLTAVLLATRSRGASPSYTGDFDPPVIGVRVPQ